MKLNIRYKLLLAFALVLLLMIAIGGYGYITSGSVEEQSVFMNKSASLNIDIVEKLKLSAVQVQQFITDASLTGSRESLTQAEKWATQFRDTSRDMLEKCQVCHEVVFRANKQAMPDIAASSKYMRDSFETMYSDGMKMSGAYMRGDKATGDRIMESFDKGVEKIQSELAARTTMGERHYQRAWKDMTHATTSAKRIILALSIVAVFTGIIAAFFIAARIERPISRVVALSSRIADGDLSGEDIDIRSKDEMGVLAKGLNTMKGFLRDMMDRISSSSKQVAAASEQLSATVKQITLRTDEQAGRANQVATSATQMSQTIVDIAKNATTISTAANDTLAVANRGGEIVEKTMEEVRQISRAVSESSQIISSLGKLSKEIGNILVVIQEIADQTNLLALNAAIEAARAGEQGRGFAVVADEVRKLAEKTVHATKQIGGMIGSIQTETDTAVKSMSESLKSVESGTQYSVQAGETLKQILSTIDALKGRVEQIATATEEMSSVSESISTDVENIAASFRETSQSNREISQSSDALARLSADMESLVLRFKL